MAFTNRWEWPGLAVAALGIIVARINEAMSKLAQSYNTHTHENDPVAAAQVQPGTFAPGNFGITGNLSVSTDLSVGNDAAVGNNLAVTGFIQGGGSLQVDDGIVSLGGSISSGVGVDPSSGATATVDFSSGNTQYVLLDANCAITLSGLPVGMESYLFLQQDATGSRLPTFTNTIIKSAPFVFSTGANKFDRLTLWYGGAAIFGALEAGWTNMS